MLKNVKMLLKTDFYETLGIFHFNLKSLLKNLKKKL